MTAPTDDKDPKKRRALTLWLAGGAAVVLGAAGITWGVMSAQSSSPSPTHSLQAVGTPVPSFPAVPGPGTSTAAPKASPKQPATKGSTAAPAPAPAPTPTPDPRFGAAVAETVKPGAPSSFGAVTVTVSPFTRVDVAASGPGEVSGPGMKATVVVTNSGTAAVDLSSLTVNGYYGSDYAPASPVASQTKALTGPLAAGQQATGTYVFSVPSDSQDAFHVTVGSGASSLILVK